MSMLSVFLLGLLKGLDKGVVNGVIAGFKYEQQDQKILIWAVKTGNSSALADTAAVGEQWVKETWDEYGNILPQVTAAIQSSLTGSSGSVDPWAESRKMTQALWAKWAGEAGLISIASPVAAASKDAGALKVSVFAPPLTTAEAPNGSGPGFDVPDVPADPVTSSRVGGDVLGSAPENFSNS
jgi:hypothetical protein